MSQAQRAVSERKNGAIHRRGAGEGGPDVGALVGVDLSPRMCDAARALREGGGDEGPPVYDGVVVGDLLTLDYAALLPGPDRCERRVAAGSKKDGYSSWFRGRAS